MAASPGRTRSEAARRAILEATRLELTERGYDKLSIDRIASAAGVGKQTVYRWYPSKSALVAEGVLHGHLLPVVVLPDTGDVRADVARWLGSLAGLGANSETAALIRATLAATAEDAVVAASYDEQVTAVTRSALLARLESGVAAGQVRPDAPVAVVVESLIGVVLFRLVTRREMGPEFVDDLVELVFGGIGT
jgi:AcrR family transcriptional regulator